MDVIIYPFEVKFNPCKQKDHCSLKDDNCISANVIADCRLVRKYSVVKNIW